MTTNPTPTPLSPEREAEIRETHPGDWYSGPWTTDYVEYDSKTDDPGYWRVIHHESGTVLATLPDWAGPIALFIADAHDAVPQLLAELKRRATELDPDAEDDDGPQTTTCGLTPKEAMLRLLAGAATAPETTAAYVKAADKERDATIAARQNGGA